MDNKIDVAVALKFSDYEKIIKDVWRRYHNKEITKQVLNFFWEAKITRKAQYVLLKWVSVNWNDTNDKTACVLDYLEKVKHYDLIRIDGEDVYTDFHTGKNILKVKYDIVLNA